MAVDFPLGQLQYLYEYQVADSEVSPCSLSVSLSLSPLYRSSLSLKLSQCAQLTEPLHTVVNMPLVFTFRWNIGEYSDNIHIQCEHS